jgi:hypothetical protein
MRRVSFIVCAAPAVLLCTAAAAAARVEVARSGGVTAGLFTEGAAHRWHLRLKIHDHGALVYDAPVRSSLCHRFCGPLLTGAGGSALRVVRVAGGGPDVVLSLYTERAHCCTLEQVFARSPGGGGFVRYEHDFGNAGVRLEPVGRRRVFVSADNAFLGRFASFAASGAPLQIWALSEGTFVDVTREFPEKIRHDAERWWRTYTANYGDGEGFLAAWAADELRLGHGSLVRRTLREQLREDHLRTDRRGRVAQGRGYVAVLKRFLRHHGYR